MIRLRRPDIKPEFEAFSPRPRFCQTSPRRCPHPVPASLQVPSSTPAVPVPDLPLVTLRPPAAGRDRKTADTGALRQARTPATQSHNLDTRRPSRRSPRRDQRATPSQAPVDVDVDVDADTQTLTRSRRVSNWTGQADRIRLSQTRPD